jgi:hypothetical protein
MTLSDKKLGIAMLAVRGQLVLMAVQMLFWIRDSVRRVIELRVADARVFPKIPGFYIALPIYMDSEKAADVIIEDARH